MPFQTRKEWLEYSCSIPARAGSGEIVTIRAPPSSGNGSYEMEDDMSTENHGQLPSSLFDSIQQRS